MCNLLDFVHKINNFSKYDVESILIRCIISQWLSLSYKIHYTYRTEWCSSWDWSTSISSADSSSFSSYSSWDTDSKTVPFPESLSNLSRLASLCKTPINKNWSLKEPLVDILCLLLMRLRPSCKIHPITEKIKIKF